MSGEKACGANLFRCLFERLSLLNELPHTLEEHERGVAFIRVKYGGLDSKGSKDTHATDAEHNFLSNPMLLVSAIEPRRKLAIAMLVLFDICIHEIKRHGAEIHTPHHDKDTQTSDVQLDQEPFVMRRSCGFDRRFPAFQQLVDIFLPTVSLDPLMKISLRVDKSHAQQRNSKVAGFLAVIAGKDS